MRKSLIIAVGALAIVALGGCAPVSANADETVGSTSLAEAGTPSSGADRRSCEAGGGFLDRRGRIQADICVHPYPDAGKACTDNLQCAGKCVTEVDDGPDGEVVGQCQADDALFGCYAEVVDSKVVRAVCVD